MKHDPRRVFQRFLRRLQRRWTPPPNTLASGSKYVVRLPQSYQQAAASLVQPKALKTAEYRERRVLDWEGVHPDIIAFTQKFIAELERRNIPFFAFELMRDPERQAELLARGTSKAKPWSSPHQYGCAVDLISATHYWDLTPKQWAVIGAIGKEIARKLNIKIEWGGDWGWDFAHWELLDWPHYKSLYDVEGRNITTKRSAEMAAAGTSVDPEGNLIRVKDPAKLKRYDKYR